MRGQLRSTCLYWANFQVIANGRKKPKGGRKHYNRPISAVIDYFVVNLVAGANRVDIESGGRSKYKLKAKVEGNEEAIKMKVSLNQ